MNADPPPLLSLAREPAVRVAGGEWLVLGAREGALLAWLAVEGPTPRYQLASLLWPESETEAARSALRQRLFKLRRLSGTPLVVGTQTLALAPGVGHDLDDAECVLGERALGLGAVFDDWLARQCAERRSRLRRSLVERSDRAAHAHEHGEAIAHARRLLSLEPLSEEAHRRLMRLHYLAGERPAALLAFDHCERLLKDEVGTGPSPETLELLQTILRAEGAGDRLLPAASVPASVLRPPRRIGRTEAWAALLRACDERRVCLLPGEPGMGKSRLLADLAQARNDAGPRVVLAQARPGDAGVSFALAARLLRTMLAAFRIVPAAAERPLVARLLPELGEVPRGALGEPSRLAAAVATVLRSCAGAGLVAVLVDDLQFADEASIELLKLLLAEPPCGWVLAWRPHELGSAAQDWIEQLQASTAIETADLQPLSPEEIGELLDSLAIAGLDRHGGEGAQVLHRHTGGNPMYALETVKAALAARASSSPAATTWPVARNVVRLIQQRLVHLSPLALQVVRCAAVAGQDADARLVARVLGMRPLELADAWGELEAAQVFRDGRFVHDLIAEAALASVPQAIARTLHGEVAEWLQLHDREPARIAEHWLAAGESGRAAPALAAAAARAMSKWRTDEAGALGARAAALFEEAGDRKRAFETLFQAAYAHWHAEIDDRLAAMRDSLYRLADDDGQRSMADLVAAGVLNEKRRYTEGLALSEQGRQKAERSGLPDIAAEHAYLSTVAHWERRELADAVRCASRAVALFAAVPIEQRVLKWRSTEMHAIFATGFLLCASGRYDEGEPRLDEARQMASRCDDLALVRDIDRAQAGVAIERGDLQLALRLSSLSVVERLATPQNATGHAMKLTRRGDALVLNGELGPALEMHEASAQLWNSHDLRYFQAPLRLAVLQDQLGRRDLARKGLLALRGRLLPEGLFDKASVESALLSIGEPGDAGFVLERAAMLSDLWARAVMLCLAASGCEPMQVLPLLNMSLATTRERGAHGLWLALQVRRAGALHAAGRAGEAAEAAHAACRRIEEGLSGLETLPAMAAALCPPLAAVGSPQAAVIASRALAWMQAAAATLPPAWRDNYLARAPALAAIRSAPARLGPP